MKTTVFFLLVLFLFGCRVNTEQIPSGSLAFNGEGYRPIYMTTSELQDIKTELPQPLRKPGKIYVKGNYLFINEQGKGIHLIDNSDQHSPKKISFIKIPANVDIAVKGNYLYADNGRDFVVLDIKDPTKIIFVKRITNVFPINAFPPVIQTYFECADDSKGIISGWEKVKMDRPKCYR